MRSRLSLVADRELPEHLIADTEHTLTHVGWLGVRRRAYAAEPLHVLHLEGTVPPVTLAHAGHDHAALLTTLRDDWISLGVACAVTEDPPDLDIDLGGDPAAAAVLLLRSLVPVSRGGDFRDDLAGRLVVAEALTDDDLASPRLPPEAQALTAAMGGRRGAVHVAGILLGLPTV